MIYFIVKFIFCTFRGYNKIEDLKQMIFQARETNRAEIEHFEKIIANPTYNYETLPFPEFLQPSAILSSLRYEKLETLILEYESHFHRQINMMEIKLDLDGWEELLEYCLGKKKSLERIFNKDIYRIKNPKDVCLEEDEIYYTSVKYQKNLLLRRIIYTCKKIKVYFISNTKK